jgi:cytoskeletal protein RodZ
MIMAEDMDMGVPPPEESGNRMFLIGAIILGGIFVLALVAIFVLYFITQSGTPAAPQPQELTATAAFQQGQTQTSEARGTETHVAQALQTAAITFTPSPTATRAITATVTQTSVVFATIAQATDTPTQTVAATVGAAGASTGTAGATATRTVTRISSPTALPQTGFGDSAGFPGLILAGGAAIVLIIAARQIRLGRSRR